MITLLFLTAAVAAVRGLWSPCGLSMLSSLNPLAERSRGHRFWITALWYVAGAIAGGALLGGACAAAAWLVGLAGAPLGLAAGLAIAGAVVALASDLRVGGWSLPDHPRQVDERWLTTYRRWLYAGGYGVQIGTGFATYVMTAGVYLLAWLAVLSGRPALALAGGVLFGAVRGATILLAALARDADRLRSLMARVEAAAGASVGVVAAAHVAVAAGAGWLLGGPLAAAVVAGVLAAFVGAVSLARGAGASAPSRPHHATAPAPAAAPARASS